MPLVLNRSQASLDRQNVNAQAGLRDLINAERDRRIAAGFAFEGHSYQFRDQDKARVTGAGALAGFAIAGGAQAGDYLWHGGAEPFTWIAADNAVVQLDARQMFAMASAGAAHESAHVFAAKALKDADPIPSNYADDVHWPV